MAVIDFSDREFKRIGEIMYEAVGLSYNDSKKSLVQSRLASRIQKLGLDGFADYIALLEDEQEAAEFQMAVDLLTTNETYFFREPKHYDLLEAELSARKNKAPLAIWSAASSFGDEAYSTAMLLSDMQQAGRVGGRVGRIGTDVAELAEEVGYDAIWCAERTEQQFVRYQNERWDGSCPVPNYWQLVRGWHLILLRQTTILSLRP